MNAEPSIRYRNSPGVENVILSTAPHAKLTITAHQNRKPLQNTSLNLNQQNLIPGKNLIVFFFSSQSAPLLFCFQPAFFQISILIRPRPPRFRRPNSSSSTQQLRHLPQLSKKFPPTNPTSFPINHQPNIPKQIPSPSNSRTSPRPFQLTSLPSYTPAPPPRSQKASMNPMIRIKSITIISPTTPSRKPHINPS